MKTSRALVNFHTLRTEGGLLPQDLLQRIALEDKTLPGLTPEAYHLDEGDRLRDAINRAWTRVTAAWRSFQAALAKLPEADRATTATRERWLFPLFDELRYGRLAKAPAATLDGRSFAISHRWHCSPVHLLGWRVDLDTAQKDTPGAARTSPHGLLQDYLNRAEGDLWGFLSNGRLLRILRDHHSLTQQAYVEFDLEAMMEGEEFSEFCLLWLLCHQSRVEAEKPAECWLERWFEVARDEGVRALDKLRDGVEAAIVAFGSGFLRHKANKRLQAELADGTLDKQEYYRELLRLVYRLIFLFVAEDRDALCDPEASEAARARYQRHYTTRRLRELADRRRGGPHGDLWQGLRLVMGRLYGGCPELGLPALGSYLWSRRAIPHLQDAELDNESLLTALRALCYVDHGKARYAVSWRNIGSEELGSVYESLLERHPEIHREAGAFALKTAAGHERKTTGSYYTPRSLVECLLDSALEPVLDEAVKKPDPEKALLELTICDPACGSGHFLVAAARRVAMRLSSVRSGGDEPSPREVRRALRDVVGRCIYGVDLNPMAVELCKVSLWMEAIEPGKPLSFLEGHIRQGNALLGATPALMAKGIPDEAFDPIEGDDKAVAKRLKKRNRDERKGQTTMFAEFAKGAPVSYGRLTTAAAAVEGDRDDDLGAVEKKEQDWERFTGSEEFERAWFLASAWCAAFVWPKQAGKLEDGAITEDLWRRMEKDPGVVPRETRLTVLRIAQEYSFFHWHLAFPQVFFKAGEGKGEKREGETTGWSGGFDVVLGNPPWERIKLQEQEFFSTRDAVIAKAPNASARKKMISALKEQDPPLWDMWIAALRVAEGQSHMARLSGKFPLCGRGDVNTYALFAELNRIVLDNAGCMSCIVPAGIVTDDTTKEFFRALTDGRELRAVYHFENEEHLFVAVHNAYRFCILTVSRAPGSEPADLSFFLRQVAQLKDPERHFSLSDEDFRLLNPNTGTCPTFRRRHDADIAMLMYHRVPILWREGAADGNPWGLRLMSMFHMAGDSGLFRTSSELLASGWRVNGNIFRRDEQRCLPLYEAKMVHQMDHRFGTYEGQTQAQANKGFLPQLGTDARLDPFVVSLPEYWVLESEVDACLAGKWSRGWLLGWRDICRSTDERTLIASVVPRVACGDTFLLMLPAESHQFLSLLLLANLCSFVLDHAARQKVGGTHLKYHVVRQLPVLPPAVYSQRVGWVAEDRLSAWLRPRALELTYTAWDLEPFAKDCGYDGPPFRWDEQRRFLLRCELDAAFFHLYGIARDDVDYIMETFPIVKRKDIAAHGDYRTKLTILDIYDRMQRAIDTGEPYKTLLDPPPADPRVAHPPRS